MTRLIQLAFGAGGVLAALAAAPGSRADEPVGGASPGEAILTRLGAGASALTYWQSGPDGWQVVTTVDGGVAGEGEHAIVRFSAVLLPGQSQSISVPVAQGEPQPVLRIRRVADRLEVGRDLVLTN